jgi:predicted AlkP superfamily pyrophosphatase or phosphodiesterase
LKRLKKFIFVVTAVFVFAAGGGCQIPGFFPAEPAPEAPTTTHIFVISIDGLRPDALDAANTPHIDELLKMGAYTPRAQTVIPSRTLPAHTSMLSGLKVEKHQVETNTYHDEMGYLPFPTIFTKAKEQGLRTALFAHKHSFRLLANPRDVDRIEFPEKEKRVYKYTFKSLGERVAHHIGNSKPELLFLHLAQTDAAGHLYGWMSKEQIETVEIVDGQIGEVLQAVKDAGIWERSFFILTSDHGGQGKGHHLPLPEVITIPWLICGPNIKKGYEIEGQVKTYDTAATVLYILGIPVPEDWTGRPVTEAFEVPLSSVDTGPLSSEVGLLKAR